MSGRLKMRLKKWSLGLKMLLLTCIYILVDIRNKIPGLVKHLMGFGTTCIDQTHSLRKNMKSTRVMNKSICGVFRGKIRPQNTHTTHKWPSPENWFETEHFEIFGFLVHGLRVLPITSWPWIVSREKFSYILKILKV